MKKALRTTALKWSLVALVTSCLALGCKSARVRECNRLIDTINALDLTPPSAADDRAVNELASLAEKGAASVGGVTLEDAQLIGFRERYQQNLRAFAKVNREVGTTMIEVKKLQGSADTSGKLGELGKRLDAQRAEIDGRAQESSKLTGEINAYCSGPNRKP